MEGIQIENPSKVFLEQKALIDIKLQADHTRHLWKMEELSYERENAERIHGQILERGRIMRAEERRSLLLKKQQEKVQ